MENIKEKFKVGDIVKVSPDLTKRNEWVTGKVIRIWSNPVLGTDIAIEDSAGRVFFGKAEFFKPLSYGVE